MSTIENCSIELLDIALKHIQENTYTQGIVGLLGKSSGIPASKKVSAVARKLFGRNIEDSRVKNLLESLLFIISKDEYDRNSLLKTLIVFSKCNNNEIKEILQNIFKEIHVGLSQEEFLAQYTSLKDESLAKKEEKKSKKKLLFVSNPELAAQLRQKKQKKTRLLKKKKLLKIAPYKRIKVDSLVIKK